MLVTPEPSPLALFGAAASGAVQALRGKRGSLAAGEPFGSTHHGCEPRLLIHVENY